MWNKTENKGTSKVNKSLFKYLLTIFIVILLAGIIFSSTLISNINETQKEINRLSTIINNTYYYKNPTYQEAINFLENDTTDKNLYNDTNYYCIHYSRDVNNNSEKNGLCCGYVTIVLKNESTGLLIPHAIVSFNTTDRGIVFFEPQTDEELIDLTIGKDYWTQCIKSGNNTHKDKYGLIVVEKLIIW